MSTPCPTHAGSPCLCAASARLRGKPGRPRTRPARPESGHTPGTAPPDRRDRGGSKGGTEASHASAPPLAPRLLGLQAAAVYLDLSPWTLRDLEAAGILPRVRVPLPHGGELRKLLFDRVDLDQAVTVWKDRARARAVGPDAVGDARG